MIFSYHDKRYRCSGMMTPEIIRVFRKDVKMFHSMSEARRIRFQLETRTTRELLDTLDHWSKREETDFTRSVIDLVKKILSERKEE